MAELPPEHLDRVHFDVDEFAPGFRMRMKSLHEPGVAVDASVFAAGIAVQGVIAQGGPIQDRLADRLSDDDLRQIWTGELLQLGCNLVRHAKILR
jgi:hypothetical protein